MSRRYNFDEEEKKILRPFKHGRQRGLEPNTLIVRIWKACNHWMGCPEDEFKNIGSIIHVFFDVAQILDDVLEYSVLRRGMPAGYLIYGIPSTVISGYYATQLALEKMIKLDEPKIIDCLIRTVIKFYEYQASENYYTKNCICPTEAEYFDMNLGRTYSPLLFSVQMVQPFTSFTGDFTNLFVKLGYFSAIVNDYGSFKCTKYADLKSFCDDVTSGIFNFPIIHAVRSRPEDTQIIDILRERTTDFEKKMKVVKAMEESGSFEYAKQTLERLKSECFKEIEKLGGNPQLVDILEEIVGKIDTEVYFDGVVKEI